MTLARRLIELAKENGADMVKFQLYSCDNLQRTPETLKVLKQNELSQMQALALCNHGTITGVEVFFSVFDEEKVDWCEAMGVKRYKIASRATDTALLAKVAETKKPVIASVSPQYKRDTAWLQGFYDIDLLYCSSKYPAPLSSLRFGDIDFKFEYQGFSDHTIGLDASKIAIARGAQIIEKHFAIDHKTGIDATWSMTAGQLRELREWTRTYQDCL